MAKIALLIGVSEYEPGLDRLPSAVNDVAAMQEVLTNPGMGEFEDAAVTVLPNPNRQAMEDAIYNLSYPVRFTKESLDNGSELELVSLAEGSFQMGAPSPEAESTDYERPLHPVTLKSFLMGKYPVTQAQWQAVAALPKIGIPLNPRPTKFKGNNFPIDRISWKDAVEFCARLSKKLGREYRLPSEAEWEYACRGETKTPFHFGETITPELANYDGRTTYGQGPKGVYRKHTTEVGSMNYHLAASLG